MNQWTMTRCVKRLLTTAALALILVLLAHNLASERAAAQAPPATEEQALAIERQLMCPVCPNERLDTSENVVAQDMKRIIREQLAAGRTPDDIILYFESRYGPGVRAELQTEGFNLLLFGWVGGSVLAVGAGGAWYLWKLRHPSRAPAHDFARAATAMNDAWLDEQVSRHPTDSAGSREGDCGGC